MLNKQLSFYTSVIIKTTDIIAQKHFMLRYFPCFEEGIFH